MNTSEILAPETIEPLLRPSPNLYEYWMLGIFMLVLVILAYVRVVYAKRLQRLYSSLVRLQILRQVMREELVFSHRASVLLFLNFVLILSLIFYAAVKYYGWNLHDSTGLSFYGMVVAAVAGIYLLKLIIASVLRLVLNDPGLLREYLYVVFLVNKAAGLILLPLALGVIYLNVGLLQNLFMAGLILAVVFILYRTAQGLILSAGYRVPWVYIILYLCTLEIIPFMVIIKALSREVL